MALQLQISAAFSVISCRRISGTRPDSCTCAKIVKEQEVFGCRIMGDRNRIWLTYSWHDNQDRDVDFIVQELDDAGLEVHLDRRDIAAGKRLWQQIAGKISDPKICDAWVFLISHNSLASEPCREELAYALDRALESRGESFPLIGLVYGPFTPDMQIPKALKVRLYVQLTDENWKQRVVEGVAGRGIGKQQTERVQPYELRIHPPTETQKIFIIEVRPRVGVWSPFVAAVPCEEREIFLSMATSARGIIPMAAITFGELSGVSSDSQHFFRQANNEATPTQSYFLDFTRLPSYLIFGASHGPQFKVSF